MDLWLQTGGFRLPRWLPVLLTSCCVYTCGSPRARDIRLGLRDWPYAAKVVVCGFWGLIIKSIVRLLFFPVGLLSGKSLLPRREDTPAAQERPVWGGAEALHQRPAGKADYCIGLWGRMNKKCGTVVSRMQNWVMVSNEKQIQPKSWRTLF